VTTRGSVAGLLFPAQSVGIRLWAAPVSTVGRAMEHEVDADWEFCAPAWHDFTRPDDEVPRWADDGYFGAWRGQRNAQWSEAP
jgi:hypothetical protein